jgi:hypothetical protein
MTAHVEAMLADGEHFPIKTYFRERKQRNMPDCLCCGEWCFGMAYGRDEYVFHFILRMSDGDARGVAAAGHAVEREQRVESKDWWDLAIDDSFKADAEIFKILDACYAYTLRQSYTRKGDEYTTDVAAARAELAKIESDAALNRPELSEPPAPAAAPVSEGKKGAQLFTLSRGDVLDHIEEMRGNPARFPVAPAAREKKDARTPDFLLCGGRVFGLMYERNDLVFNFALRMSGETAARLNEYHPLKRASFPAGEGWYALTVDMSYESKKEVYRILDECYDYALKVFYRSENGAYKTDGDAAAAEIAALAAGADGKSDEEAAAAAEREYRAALERYKAENFSEFKLTRKEIVGHMRQTGGPDTEIVERPKSPQLPTSLNCGGKNYAMLYGAGGSVRMIVRVSDGYADNLAVNHPEVCRAKFPKGRNWYLIPVDGAFRGKEDVYKVLDDARTFVTEYGAPPKKSAPARKGTAAKSAPAKTAAKPAPAKSAKTAKTAAKPAPAKTAAKSAPAPKKAAGTAKPSAAQTAAARKPAAKKQGKTAGRGAVSKKNRGTPVKTVDKT